MRPLRVFADLYFAVDVAALRQIGALHHGDRHTAPALGRRLSYPLHRNLDLTTGLVLRIAQRKPPPIDAPRLVRRLVVQMQHSRTNLVICGSAIVVYMQQK